MDAETKIKVTITTIKGCLSDVEKDLKHTKEVLEQSPDNPYAKIWLEHYETKKKTYEFVLEMLEDES